MTHPSPDLTRELYEALQGLALRAAACEALLGVQVRPTLLRARKAIAAYEQSITYSLEKE